MKKIKILVGGVPFGRDNVGDEAIIATIVHSIIEAVPEAEISISTDTPEDTSRKLGVRTVPLFGFDPPGFNLSKLRHELENTDVFCWGGATGLSDYPEVTLKLCELAMQLDCQVVLFGVGMNDQLNEAHYRLRPGKKMSLLRMLGWVFLKRIDFVKLYESWLKAKVYRRIVQTLNRVDLIIVRDKGTKQLLEALGVNIPIEATADTAMLLPLSSPGRIKEIWQEQDLWLDQKPIFALGISAQREVRQLDDIVRLADELTEKYDGHILFVPMNPKTDFETMKQIKTKMKFGEEARLLTGEFEPEEIAAILSKTKLAISSRLHMLILASISEVPVVGLSRGSKIDRFLKRLGESSSGQVEAFDPQVLLQTCQRLIEKPEEFTKRAHAEIVLMKKQAASNARKLVALLHKD